MARLTLTVALVLMLALPALVSSREPPQIDHCAADGGRTLLANRSVRLYVITTSLGNQYARYCWIRTGRTTTLPAGGLDPPFRIAGRYFARASQQWDTKQPIDDGVVITVAVRDVKRDRCIVAFDAQPPESGLGEYTDADPGVTDLELGRAGALAWIVSGRPNRDDYFYVQKADAGGQVVLDEGPSIDPRSLAITGRRIYWTNAGVPRSAVLQGRARDADCPKRTAQRSAGRLPVVGSQEQRRAYRIDRCADNGGRTLVASRWVRVYVRRDRLDNEYLRYCWVRTGDTTTLKAQGDSATALVPEYRIAGRYLGSVVIDFDRKQPTYPGVDLIVGVRDVKRDRCVTGFRAQPPNSGVFRYDDRTPGVTDLELSSEGGLAWIVSGPPNRDDYFYVQKADAGGQVVLDEGLAIDMRSLAISGRRIYWMNGDTPRSAVLDGRARSSVCP